MARLAILIPDMRGGGAERVALTLIEGFIERGHTLDLVLFHARGELLKLLPPEVRIVDLGVDRFRQAIGPLVRYLRESRPDALQASMWPVTLVAILARLISRVPFRLVLSEHSNAAVQFRDQPARLKLAGWSIKLLYPRADARICVSQNLARDLAALSGLRASAFEVIYNPIAKSAFEPASTAGAEIHWKGAGRRIITVGSLKPEKNHALLLRAFAQLHKAKPANLMILGEGELRPSIERLIGELGIDDAVTMPGYVLDPTPFYQSADVFALSSDSEGLPLVLVEALAAGLPVVSTDCPTGPSEILGDGRFGRLVPVGNPAALADALERALGEQVVPALRKTRARQFRPEAAVERYLELMLT